MAERRMFSLKIIDSDAFLDLPPSAQALYFHLGMRADDDGFLNNPRKIQRMVGASVDDLKLLIAKRFLLAFDNGVVAVKHWKINNQLRKDRYNPTQYQAEKETLTVKENGAYTEHGNHMATTWQPLGNHLATQVSIGKVSIGKYSDDLIINNYINARTRAKLIELCGSVEAYTQLIRYADYQIQARQEPTPISDYFLYLKQIGQNAGFIAPDGGDVDE